MSNEPRSTPPHSAPQEETSGSLGDSRLPGVQGWRGESAPNQPCSLLMARMGALVGTARVLSGGANEGHSLTGPIHAQETSHQLFSAPFLNIELDGLGSPHISGMP